MGIVKVMAKAMAHALSKVMASASAPFFAPQPPGVAITEGFLKKPLEDEYGFCKVGSSLSHASWDAQEWPKAADQSVYIALVADGVTAKAGGKQASKLAVDTIIQTLQPQVLPVDTPAVITNALEQAIREAHQTILREAQKTPEMAGMSTTLVVAAIAGQRLHVAHLGDCRAYLLRRRRLHCLTLDHTWIQEALDDKRIKPSAARLHPNRNVVKQYLGLKQQIVIDHTLIVPGAVADPQQRQLAPHLLLTPGDVLLLCSDGLTERLTDATLQQILDWEQDRPAVAADKLVAKAMAAQEPDNITALVIAFPAAARLARLQPPLRRAMVKLQPLVVFVALLLVVFGLFNLVQPAFIATVMPTASTADRSSLSTTITLGTPQLTMTVNDAMRVTAIQAREADLAAEQFIPGPAGTTVDSLAAFAALPTTTASSLTPTESSALTESSTPTKSAWENFLPILPQPAPNASRFGPAVTPTPTMLPLVAFNRPTTAVTLAGMVRQPTATLRPTESPSPTPLVTHTSPYTPTSTPMPLLTPAPMLQLVRGLQNGDSPQTTITIELDRAVPGLPAGQFYEWRVWPLTSDYQSSGRGLESARATTAKLVDQRVALIPFARFPFTTPGAYQFALVVGRFVQDGVTDAEHFQVVARQSDIVTITYQPSNRNEEQPTTRKKKQ